MARYCFMPDRKTVAIQISDSITKPPSASTRYRTLWAGNSVATAISPIVPDRPATVPSTAL